MELKSTLFIVASKSGSTLEPSIFKQYFFERVEAGVGADRAGEQFVAVTDPGSKLDVGAQADRFWQLFYGVQSIGGRYGALSDCGMVPAAVLGLDVRGLLERAQNMVVACLEAIPPYVEMNRENEQELQAMRNAVRDRTKAATESGSRVGPASVPSSIRWATTSFRYSSRQPVHQRIVITQFFWWLASCLKGWREASMKLFVDSANRAGTLAPKAAEGTGE